MNKAIDFNYYEQDIGRYIGQNLAWVRRLLTISQQELACLLGVSLSQYKKYEQGKDHLKIHLAGRWSVLTGSNLYCLLLGSKYHELLPQLSYVDDLKPLNLLISRLDLPSFRSYLQLILPEGQALPYWHEPAPDPEFSWTRLMQQLDGDYYVHIARNLRAWRQQQHLTQEEVAEYLGITSATYACYERENDINRFSLLMAPRFSLAFGSNTWFLGQGTYYAWYRVRQEIRFQQLQSHWRLMNPEQRQHALMLAEPLRQRLWQESLAWLCYPLDSREEIQCKSSQGIDPSSTIQTGA